MRAILVIFFNLEKRQSFPHTVAINTILLAIYS